MKSVSMLHFRLHAEEVISQVQKGQRIVLTRRGKPVVRLEPIREDVVSADDPFFSLAELHAETGTSLSNAQIDSVIYGE